MQLSGIKKGPLKRASDCRQTRYKSSLSTVFFVLKSIIETIFEVMNGFLKHNTIQRDQVEMIALDEISTSESLGPKNRGSH